MQVGQGGKAEQHAQCPSGMQMVRRASTNTQGKHQECCPCAYRHLSVTWASRWWCYRRVLPAWRVRALWPLPRCAPWC